MPQKIHVSCPVAPEDLRTGDYVCVMEVTYEIIPCMFDGTLPQRLPVRVTCLPHGDLLPLLVVAASLPFVLVENAHGKTSTLDLRRYRLARVPTRYARKAIKRARSAERKKDK